MFKDVKVPSAPGITSFLNYNFNNQAHVALLLNFKACFKITRSQSSRLKIVSLFLFQAENMGSFF